MEKKNSFMYDDFSDRLLISCKKNSEKVAGSIRFLNLVIDFSSTKKIVNVELRKASDYLKSLGLNSKILNNLTGADLMFKQCRDGYLISFILETSKGRERIPYNIQSLKAPLLTSP